MARSPKQYFPEFKYNKVILDTIVTVPLLASSVPQHVFTADQAYQVTWVSEIHSTAGSTGAAARLRKITDTSAPGAAASATVVEQTTANFDLTATVNTSQTGALSTTLADIRLAAGDKLAVNLTGTLTGLVGNITIALRRI
jgi:hypothetical protein